MTYHDSRKTKPDCSFLFKRGLRSISREFIAPPGPRSTEDLADNACYLSHTMDEWVGNLYLDLIRDWRETKML